MRIAAARRSALLIALPILMAPPAVRAALEVHAGVYVDAAGVPIQTEGYTTPCFANWNEDGLGDLIVGDGCGTIPGRVLVFLNVGEPGAPAFGDFFYAESEGDTLVIEPHG